MGRGLAAILPPPREEGESLHRVPPDLIDPNPRQPRRAFDEAELRGLADSIAARGVLQPLLVRSKPGGRYELIAGERRLRAARLAGLEDVPAVVRSADEHERLELALIENMARQDLNPVDAARASAALVDELGLTKEEVALRVGRSRAAVSNLIRLLELPDEVLAMLEAGELSEGHGRALLQAGDRAAQRTLARRARDGGLSVRETEALARAKPAGGTTAPRSRPALVPADAIDACRELEEALGAALGHDVRVRPKGSGAAVEIRLDDIASARALARRFSRRLAA
jgi:ParB family chromosome partitioning protein